MDSLAPLVWVDLEMTGLNLEKEKIMEIAVIVTDSQLNIVGEMDDSIVVHVEDSYLNAMDAWCKKHHGENGLTEKCRNSQTSLEEAEKLTLQFVKKFTKEPGTAILAGNSIHMDRRFINKYMPLFDQFLSYRMVDVSSFKEMMRRWYPTEFASLPPKKNTHRALDDIKESIAELQYYKKHMMK